MHVHNNVILPQTDIRIRPNFINLICFHVEGPGTINVVLTVWLFSFVYFFPHSTGSKTLILACEMLFKCNLQPLVHLVTTPHEIYVLKVLVTHGKLSRWCL